uniref:C-type lectin domain-containing protein n=1 Tax=Salmo trutta TaxID=8032 RepID=A0A674B1I6_SALTR
MDRWVPALPAQHSAPCPLCSLSPQPCFGCSCALPGEELSQNSCPMGWYDFNGRCYKYVATPLNWPDAESYCLTQGANLVSVHSEAEHQFIKILIQRFDPAERGTWMGLSDIHVEGRGMWSDGSKVDFIPWRSSTESKLCNN